MKTVLVVADFPGWAYHQIAVFVRQALLGEYDVYFDYVSFNQRKEFKKKLTFLQECKRSVLINIGMMKYRRVRKDNSYDIVLFLGFYFDTSGYFDFKSKKLIKGIYTQGFPPQGMDYDWLRKSSFSGMSVTDFRDTYLSNADALVCGAPIIQEFYEKHSENVHFANCSYDENLFSPARLKAKSHDKLTVGWTGNPKRDFKGFYTHVIPAVELAKSVRPGINLKTRFHGSFNTLPQFYEDVDVVLIASEADAGPSMFIEASLCGVPSISTDIGMPHSVINDSINGFFVSRDIDEMAERLVQLYDDRSLLNEMSGRIRDDYISTFGVEVQKTNWLNLMARVLENG